MIYTAFNASYLYVFPQNLTQNPWCKRNTLPIEPQLNFYVDVKININKPYIKIIKKQTHQRPPQNKEILECYETYRKCLSEKDLCNPVFPQIGAQKQSYTFIFWPLLRTKQTLHNVSSFKIKFSFNERLFQNIKTSWYSWFNVSPCTEDSTPMNIH